MLCIFRQTLFCFFSLFCLLCFDLVFEVSVWFLFVCLWVLRGLVLFFVVVVSGPTVIRNNDAPLPNIDITGDEISSVSLIKLKKEENIDFWFSFPCECQDEFFDSDQYLE